MKSTLLCAAAAVLGLVVVGSAQVEAGRYRNVGHRSYNNHRQGRSNDYNRGHRGNSSYGDMHSGYGQRNSYGRSRGRSNSRGYSGVSLQINGNRFNYSFTPSRGRGHRRINYGH